MGREFLDLFDEWAKDYDQAVIGKDPQYVEVFSNYEQILSEVANRSYGKVLEFGVGTGNLTKVLFDQGYDVVGIEPSTEMRKVAKQKLPAHIPIKEGDFLTFPLEKDVTTIVSSYAFHHLTDEEKEKAFNIYSSLLKKQGKVVFADTMFESDRAFTTIIEEAKEKGYNRLAEDLLSEYYTTIPNLKRIAEDTGFTVHFTQLNDFVWILDATKVKD
ncbi:class I SAM-dependent methyltransferase [Bacillus carboniphilus]|uniref:Uncharacterized methyltransferase GCM10008967_33850 n=1 Tax=Bacillus carboniphilus TaxID=86663 RepID=A0ABP3GE27_9BACI